jgi:Fe-S cluster assembly scaffold protein SufB
MGLLLAEDSSINAIPELVNNHKDASLTHEASVGKISEEVLNYLRSRGLTEDQAIDLIVSGFLGEEEPITVEGHIIPSKLYM